MINRKRNALTILRPQSRRRGLFCIKSKITFPRLFLFPRVCLHFSQFGKQTRAHSPTFVSFPPRLFTYQPILETNTGTFPHVCFFSPTFVYISANSGNKHGKVVRALRFKLEGRSERKQGRDSRFFAAKEVSLSAEGGDSPREQEKSRISVMKDTKKF